MARTSIAAPPTLSGVALERWRTVAPLLAKRGAVDRDELAAYCLVWARWRQNEAAIAKAGTLVKNATTGRVKASPLIGVGKEAAQQLRTLEKRLGLGIDAPKADLSGANPDSNGPTITRRDLAKRLKVHMQTVTKWEREGLPIAWRGRKGKPSRYDETAVRAWVDAREAAGGASNSSFAKFQEAGARQRNAQAELAELQLSVRRGRLVDAEAMRTRMADVFLRCRTKLLAVPAKAKTLLPHLTHADVLTLDALVRESLEDLATPEPKGAAA
jgi:P27 family predicted phage terminase small subunit